MGSGQGLRRGVCCAQSWAGSPWGGAAFDTRGERWAGKEGDRETARGGGGGCAAWGAGGEG